MSQSTDNIAGIWDRVQRGLFPALEEAGLEMNRPGEWGIQGKMRTQSRSARRPVERIQLKE